MNSKAVVLFLSIGLAGTLSAYGANELNAQSPSALQEGMQEVSTNSASSSSLLIFASRRDEGESGERGEQGERGERGW